MAAARKGKIARLPQTIRAELCRRMANGEPDTRLIAWLNGQPDVIRILDDLSFGGVQHKAEITDGNLSEWRDGGYRDWLSDQEEITKVRALTEFAQTLGEASGGDAAAGGATILSGRILQRLEGADDDALERWALTLSRLRTSDANSRSARVSELRAADAQRRTALAEKQFQYQLARETLKQFLADEEARTIMGSQASHEDKIARLLAHMEAMERQAAEVSP